MSRRYKRPESVLVVIYTGAGEVLLLDRVQPAGYWQSVTGSLKDGETPLQAAVREVQEETGLEVADRIIDCGYSNRFRILPAWRARYAPEVQWNTEHVFRVELPEKVPISISSAEHTGVGWFPVREAVERIGSRTNREAVEQYVHPD